jgi:hypothetical protein
MLPALLVILMLPVLACSSDDAPVPPDTNDPVTAYDLGDGHKLYDLIPDFLAYAEQAAQGSEQTRAALWNSMLEAKWEDFFNQVLYRDLQGTERENHKTAIIDEFWNTIVPDTLDALRRTHAAAAQKILSGRTRFTAKFPSFAPGCDYYLTVAFSFHGKADDVNGTTVLAVGLEHFTALDKQLDFVIAHEQYHLYHFGLGFSAQGGLYRGLWTEGLATYAQLYIHPGSHTYSELLGFPGSRIDEIVRRFDELKADVTNNIFTTDQAIKRAYLGAEDNTLGIPPACGYYIGLRIVMTLLERGETFDAMASWTSDRVQTEMLSVLPSLTAQ